MNYSYVMGIDSIINELKNDGFVIEMDGDNFMVSFSEDKEEIWEKFISTHLKLGYWNEYLTGKAVVFLFHLQEGIKKYVVINCENDEVLGLCEKLCECKFESLKTMLSENHFYRDKINQRFAEECIYVGDGGSNELETARKLGMKAVQAAWYLQEGTTQPAKRKHDFFQMEKPGFPVVDSNTIMKTDGPEKDIPHYYVELNDILDLLCNFDIVQIKHVDNCFFGGSKKNSAHYYIEAILKEEQ